MYCLTIGSRCQCTAVLDQGRVKVGGLAAEGRAWRADARHACLRRPSSRALTRQAPGRERLFHSPGATCFLASSLPMARAMPTPIWLFCDWQLLIAYAIFCIVMEIFCYRSLEGAISCLKSGLLSRLSACTQPPGVAIADAPSVF